MPAEEASCSNCLIVLANRCASTEHSARHATQTARPAQAQSSDLLGPFCVRPEAAR